MKFRKASTEYIETYADQVNRIVEALRWVRESGSDWSPMLTDQSIIGELFCVRTGWLDEAATCARLSHILGVPVESGDTIVAIARRMRAQ